MNISKEELQHLEASEYVSDCHTADIESDVEECSLGEDTCRPSDSRRAGGGGVLRRPLAPPEPAWHSWENFHAMKRGLIVVVFMIAMILVLMDDYRVRREQTLQHEALAANIVIAHDEDNLSVPGGNTTITPDVAIRNHDNPTTPSFSLLPKRIYSVIGLEDSGTQFVSRLIRDALGFPHYREGSFPCRQSRTGRSSCSEYTDVQVQHFSLPWGSTCQANPNPPVVDVVLPSQCTRLQTTNQERTECREMVKSIWSFEKTDKRAIKYPPRYQLDIVSHKAWYDAQGVEQYFVIVVRDQKISSIARTKHCSDPKLKQEEEDVGTDIIVDAINTFILSKNNSNHHHNVTRETYQYWAAQQFQNHHAGHKNRRKLSALPFENNVAVVSYESLVKLGNTYVEMLYEVLDIDSNYFPEILNSNAKYVMNGTSSRHLT